MNPDECDAVDPGPTDPCDEGLVSSREDAEDLCYYLIDPSGNFIFYLVMDRTVEIMLYETFIHILPFWGND